MILIDASPFPGAKWDYGNASIDALYYYELLRKLAINC